MDTVSFRHSLLSVVAAGVVAGLPIGAVMMIRSSCSVVAPASSPATSAFADAGDAADVVPVIAPDGAVVGVRIAHVHATTFVAHLGLREGDVVTTVNGHPVDSTDDIFNVYAAREVAIDFVRDGQRGTLRHSL